MRNWCETVFDKCMVRRTESEQQYQNCKAPCEKLPFTAMTVNIGAATVMPRDLKNHPLCPRVVYSVGNHDHRLGGHIVTQEGRLAVEFPGGCICIINSAVKWHSNVPVKETESQRSLTMYVAGGIDSDSVCSEGV